MLPAQPNQSVIDAIACLQALAVAPRPVGVRELARQLDLEPTRAHRLAATLAALGIVRRTDDRRYTPGPGMHVLAAQALYGSGLLRHAAGPLESLLTLGYTVALGVLWKRQVCYLFHGRAGEPFSAGVGRTALFPATRSSIGMVLLAAMPPDAVRELYADHVPEGFDSLSQLLAELDRVRRRGHARVVNHRRPLSATLAVPIGTRPDAAVALAGAIRAADAARLLQPLREAAAIVQRGDDA
jgi:DNA-binding IclR family transcriptional regulator